MRLFLAAAMMATAAIAGTTAQAADSQISYTHLGELSLAVPNAVEIAVTGEANAFDVLQEAPKGAALGNRLALTVTGNGNGATSAFTGAAARAALNPGRIVQRGQTNAMTVSLLGDANLFAATQVGTRNSLSAAMIGTGNQAAVLQSGHGNVAAFTQTGHGNTLGIVQRSW